jgi:hypothetical protein
MKPDGERPPESRLLLLVEDSGRTWSVLHHEINRIPPEAIQKGDVFIVRHATEPGVMFMQATRPHRTAWRLEALELAPKEAGA